MEPRRLLQYGALYLVSLMLRIYGAGDAPFKLGPLNHARKSIPELFASYPAASPHPPVFYISLHYWIDLFGTTEPAVRALPLLVGALVPLVVYALGTEITTRRTGSIGAVLAVFYPPAVYYSQLTRMYSFVIVLTPLSFVFLIRMMNDPTRKTATYYVLTTLALFYSHVLTLAVVGVQILWTATVLLFRDEDIDYRYWGTVSVSVLVPIAAWLPMFLWNLLNFSQPIAGTSGPRQFLQYNSGGLVSLLLVSLLAVCFVATRWLPPNVTRHLVGTRDVQLRRTDLERLGLLVAWVVLPLLGIVVGFELWGEVYRTKYGLPSSIGFLTLSGYVLARYSDLRATVLLGLVVLAYQFQSRWLIPGHYSVVDALLG